nr:MAG TPA: hypothetical protein [Caudoviricetes sp.]
MIITLNQRKIPAYQGNNRAIFFRIARVRVEKTKRRREHTLCFHSKGEKRIHSMRTRPRYFLGPRRGPVVGHRAAKPL